MCHIETGFCGTSISLKSISSVQHIDTETLGSLYSHALLILTGSSKSKNQVVHEQMFKDLPSSKCPVSVERSMFNLKSDVQWFNTHWGNILLLEFFVFT